MHSLLDLPTVQALGEQTETSALIREALKGMAR